MTCDPARHSPSLGTAYFDDGDLIVGTAPLADHRPGHGHDRSTSLHILAREESIRLSRAMTPPRDPESGVMWAPPAPGTTAGTPIGFANPALYARYGSSRVPRCHRRPSRPRRPPRAAVRAGAQLPNIASTPALLTFGLDGALAATPRLRCGDRRRSLTNA